MASAVAARALWAGPGAARVLAGAPAIGAVELALHPGGYVRFGEDRWLLVAVPAAPRGPLSLLVAGLDGAPLRPGDEAVLDTTGLRVGALHIERKSTCSAIARTTLRSRASGWRDALAAALAVVPPAPRDLAPGFAALRHGNLTGAVLALAGRGEGLTPAGDDILAGYAAWRHAEGRPVSVSSERCSPLGLAYLRCAQRGELAEPADAVLRAVRAGDAGGARRGANALAAWGSSSGAAILWGMAAAA
jgi:hypothetical protein